VGSAFEMSDRTGRLREVETWIFDLDNTLYHPSVSDLFPQMEQRMIAYIAELLGLDPEAANAHRDRYFRSYGTTLRGLMEMHGVAPQAFLDYVHELDLETVRPNPALEAALARLPGRKIVFTNATERHAVNVMQRLGVSHHFDDVFDVAAAEFVPKPQRPAYDRFLARHAVDPRRAAMFEDMAKNLEPAAALGMSTVWVRTDRPQAQFEPGCDFVHHVAENLVEWLEETITLTVPETRIPEKDGQGRR